MITSFEEFVNEKNNWVDDNPMWFGDDSTGAPYDPTRMAKFNKRDGSVIPVPKLNLKDLKERKKKYYKDKLKLALVTTQPSGKEEYIPRRIPGK